jgi:DNA-binding CsgD family transcriptional regulator
MRDERFLVFQPDAILLRAIDRVLRLLGERVLLQTVEETRRALGQWNDWAAFVFDLDGGAGFDLLKVARDGGCESRALIIAAEIDESCAHNAVALNACLALRSVKPATLLRFAVRPPPPLPSPQTTVRDWGRRYRLTPTESNILAAAANGDTHIQIAHDRGISPRTLQKHVENLLRKTQDDTLAAAAVRVLRNTLRAAES